jgi:hypothetical protein
VNFSISAGIFSGATCMFFDGRNFFITTTLCEQIAMPADAGMPFNNRSAAA